MLLVKQKRILLSAYACEPGRGSEPGVGWHWAMEIARRGHEVWVLTRANNQPCIEAWLSDVQSIPNLNFLYYDLPAWLRRWKKKVRGGIYVYYVLWQWGAYRFAKASHKRKQFDVAHHITFVSVRFPSFLGNLGAPFIFGPLAGGERAPWRLRAGYGWRGWILDGLRDLSNLLVRVAPLMRQTFRQAERIYATSEQTISLLPRKHRAKASVHLPIGFDAANIPSSSDHLRSSSGNKGEFSLLYVGRLLFWKGMHLGLPAFARLLEKLGWRGSTRHSQEG